MSDVPCCPRCMRPFHVAVPDGAVAVPLTRGMHALIDRGDAPLVLQFDWSAQQRQPGLWYATRLGGRIGMHRMLLSAPDGMVVDHINGNGLDNRRSNLRLATPAQNSANTKASVSSRSGFKGVSFHRGRWRACIMVAGRSLHLGRFDTPEEAAHAYDIAATKNFGSFARLNFGSPDLHPLAPSEPIHSGGA